MGPCAGGPPVNAEAFHSVATSLVEAGAPGLPTIMLARELPLFEVDLAALEFAEDVTLPGADWAVLALARALGEVTPADVDGYLGLGEVVSEALLRRLVAEALLQDRDAERVETETTGGGLTGFFRRLFGGSASAGPATPRSDTMARKLRESRAAVMPSCILATGGSQALERGVASQRHVRPARLLFTADPLVYVDTIDEKRQRFTQHRRARPLDPEEVPPPFRALDSLLGSSPEARRAACGIDAALRGFPGRLVGIVPGEPWEVRPFVVSQRGRRDEVKSPSGNRQFGLLIVAGFPSSEAEGLRWRVYLRAQDKTRDCPHLDAEELFGPHLLDVPNLLDVASFEDVVDQLPTDLRADGAFELRCSEEALPRLLGAADRPDDTFLAATAPDWWVGFRVHALPRDPGAARAAFFEFLGRREAPLRREFDATCSAVAATLRSYWGEEHDLPSPDDAARLLWSRHELRAALCMRRLAGDLVDPYADTGRSR